MLSFSVHVRRCLSEGCPSLAVSGDTLINAVSMLPSATRSAKMACANLKSQLSLDCSAKGSHLLRKVSLYRREQKQG